MFSSLPLTCSLDWLSFTNVISGMLPYGICAIWLTLLQIQVTQKPCFSNGHLQTKPGTRQGPLLKVPCGSVQTSEYISDWIMCLGTMKRKRSSHTGSEGKFLPYCFDQPDIDCNPFLVQDRGIATLSNWEAHGVVAPVHKLSGAWHG